MRFLLRDINGSLVEAWRLAEHDGELPVGEAVVVPTGDPAIPLLISAPTMRIPWMSRRR